MSDKFGFDEVVDTLADLLDVYDIAEAQLKDGFQFTDSFAIIQIYPKLQEVYTDRKTFVEQFADLSPEESAQVVEQLARRTNSNPTKVKTKVVAALAMTSRTYAFLDSTVAGAKTLANDWKLFATTVLN